MTIDITKAGAPPVVRTDQIRTVVVAASGWVDGARFDAWLEHERSEARADGYLRGWDAALHWKKGGE